MTNFDKGGRGLCLPQNVETQCLSIRQVDIASLRKKRKHTTAVQRGEIGIPRSVQIYLQVWLKAYSLQPIACGLLFVSLLFSLEARPQSPGSREAAPGQRQEFVREINGTVIDAVTKEPLLGVSLVIYVDSVKYVGRASRDGGRFDFRGTH